MKSGAVNIIRGKFNQDSGIKEIVLLGPFALAFDSSSSYLFNRNANLFMNYEVDAGDILLLDTRSMYMLGNSDAGIDILQVEFVQARVTPLGIKGMLSGWSINQIRSGE